MNFIEQLKSVGGVKPCPNGCLVYEHPEELEPIEKPCEVCHGTGRVIDLAPLLAKSKELEAPVFELIAGLVVGMYPERMAKGKAAKLPGGKTRYRCFDQFLTDHRKRLHVVGPQRAHSLVYEIARQLGGTAVVAVEDRALDRYRSRKQTHYAITEIEAEEDTKVLMELERQGAINYRLSLPIPDSATILFVTDRVDEKELDAIIRATWNPDMTTPFPTILPYILSLVANKETYRLPWVHEKGFNIISLHQERV